MIKAYAQTVSLILVLIRIGALASGSMAERSASIRFDFLDGQHPSTGASASSDLPLSKASVKVVQPVDFPQSLLLQDPIDSLTGTVLAATLGPKPVGPVAVDKVTGLASGSPGERAPEVLTYIITLDSDGLPLADRAREVLGLVRPEALFSNLGMFTVRLTAAQAEALSRRPGVLGVEQDQVVTLVLPDQREVDALRKPGGGSSTTPSEILDWGVQQVWGGSDRRNEFQGKTFFSKVFVLDTGISGSTQDLNYNISMSRDFTSSASGFYDKNGHGTHVAGTIAALANGRGVVGVAPGVTVIAYKVLNDRGSGTISGIVNAIDAMIAVADVGDVANMSLGAGFSKALNDAVLKAATGDKKILFSIAAGNSYADVDGYSPASIGDSSKGIFTVSAYASNGRNASFTNYDNFGGTDADNVAYAAPGVGIVSLKRDGTTTTLSGTSMAAPHVAGLLVLGGTNAFHSSPGFANAYGNETPDPLAVWSGMLA